MGTFAEYIGEMDVPEIGARNTRSRCSVCSMWAA